MPADVRAPVMLDGAPPSGTSEDGAPAAIGDVTAAIETEFVRIYKGSFDRGPAEIRASWFHDDTGIVVTLADPYTRGEQTLIASERFNTVRTARVAVHCAIEAELKEAIESITAREVSAVLTQVSEKPQLCCFVFCLAPAPAA